MALRLPARLRLGIPIRNARRAAKLTQEALGQRLGADELDLAPRRARRALARLFERLQRASFRLEELRVEVERLLARD